MPVQNLFGPLKCLWESGVLTIFKYPKADFILGCPVLSRKFTNSNPKNIIIVNLQNSRIISYAWVKVWLYKSGMQTSPLILTGFWGVYSDLCTPAHILSNYPWSHDSKMGWTIPVSQNSPELDQFSAGKLIIEFIVIKIFSFVSNCMIFPFLFKLL